MGTKGWDVLPQSDDHLDRSEVLVLRREELVLRREELVLRREDGSFVAAFDAREVTSEDILKAAKEDQARSVQARATGPSDLRDDDARKTASANGDAGRSRLDKASRSADAGGERECGARTKAKKTLRKRGSVARRRPPATGGEEEVDGLPTGGRDGSGPPGPPLERAGLPPTTHQGRVRWYNPMLEDFEWREVPQTDEQALEVLDDPPRSLACAQAYREWRGLGASIKEALMRAGEAAKAEREKREADARRARSKRPL